MTKRYCDRCEKETIFCNKLIFPVDITRFKPGCIPYIDESIKQFDICSDCSAMIFEWMEKQREALP